MTIFLKMLMYIINLRYNKLFTIINKYLNLDIKNRKIISRYTIYCILICIIIVFIFELPFSIDISHMKKCPTKIKQKLPFFLNKRPLIVPLYIQKHLDV